MKFEVDVDKLIRYKLDFESYCLLYTLYLSENSDILKQYIQIIGKDKLTIILHNLVNLKYIINKNNNPSKYVFEAIEITNLFRQHYLPPKVEGVEEWITTWHELWPVGIKNLNGNYIRGDKNGALSKMKAFIKNNPLYTKGVIIAATKKYLSVQRTKGYTYCTQSHYFVIKDSISLLSTFCDEVLRSINTEEDIKEDGKTQLGTNTF